MNLMGTKVKVWFSVGDILVYPGYGVGVVQNIEERTLGETSRLFCVLSFKETENESKVMIPIDNVHEVRLRRLSDTRCVQEALGYLSNGDPEIVPSWRERFAMHGDLLAAGDLMSVVRVLKALYIVNSKKPLSFREKKMYQKAMLLITSEVCEVLKAPRQEVEADILSRLAKN